MSRPTSPIVTISFCLACLSACSKNKSETFNPDEAALFRDQDPYAPRPGSSNDDLLHQAMTSASASIDSMDPSDDPSTALECPNASAWTKFDAFAAPCVYAWTTDAQKLPNPPEWQRCSPLDGPPAASCKKLKRSRRPKTFYVGGRGSKEMQIGFVEKCATDQIVLADIDGPTRFALRRAETTQYPATCQVKLLAVDQGQWLAAIGGHELPSDFNASGYSAGGAFIGGTIGSAPNVLFSQASDPFHVATSQGTILPDGWIADGKRRHWNGKSIEKPPRIGTQRLTKSLLLDEKKGFYQQKGTELKPLLEVPQGRTFVSALIQDKQIVWQEHAEERIGKTCTLMAGEIDAQNLLTQPRRIAEISCTSSKYVLGCNTVLLSNETHLALVSLTNGSSRTLRMKAQAVAVGCEEVFVERAGSLLRINLLAFGPPKAPALPPLDMPLRSGQDI